MADEAWIHRLDVALRVIQGPLLLWVQDAHLAQLGTLLRGLQGDRDPMRVERDRGAIDRLPPGSTFVLIPRPGDAAWLNQRRPVLTARSLRVILWTDPAVTAEMASDAVDFVDWTTRTVLCPEGPPRFVFAALRAALCARLPVIPYAGAHLAAVLARLLPGRAITTLPFTRNYDQIVEQLRAHRDGWLVITGLPDRYQLRRLVWAMAEAGRRGRIILENPGPDVLPWLIEERTADLDDALSRLTERQAPHAGRCVALLDAEPAAIDAAVALLDGGLPPQALADLLEASSDPAAALGERLPSSSPLLRRRFTRASDSAHQLYLDWARQDAPQRTRSAIDLQDIEVASRWLARCPTPTSEEASATQLELSAEIDIALARWSDARQKLERSLAIRENVLGTQEHPSVATTMTNLAVVLQAQGDWSGAQLLFERSLTVWANALGTKEHPSVATVMSNLAGVLQAQGDLSGARLLFERSLSILEKVLGTKEHPSVATAMSNLAGVLQAQGDLSGARLLFERSLAIQEKALGTAEHPSLATAMNNLAGVLQAQGDLSGARLLFERSLSIWEKVLGAAEHPSVATAMTNLAGVLQAQGDLYGARLLLERSLSIWENVLDTQEHLDVAATVSGLVLVLLRLGKKREALKFMERLRLLLKEQTPGHPLLPPGEGDIPAKASEPPGSG